MRKMAVPQQDASNRLFYRLRPQVTDTTTPGGESKYLLPRIWRLLGEPEDLGRGLGDSVIESYAQRRLQLSFNRGRLILIAVYFRHEHVDPNNRVRLVWDLPSDEMLTDQAPLLGWLESAGIPFRLASRSKRSSSPPAGDWSTWVVDGGATLTFTAGRLDSIQVAHV